MVKESHLSSSSSPGSKRFRPPHIDVSRADKKTPNIELEAESPISLDLSDDEFEDTLQLSSPESSGPNSPISSALPSLTVDPSIDAGGDDILKDLAALDELRKNVKKNLKLRPIRSRNNLRVDSASDLASTPRSPFPPKSASSWQDHDGGPLTALSPTSSIASSYFTPISETPHSALFATSSNSDAFPALDDSLPRPPSSVSAKALHNRLLSPKRPLLIDTRPLAVHEAFHIRHSINIAIPSLILKRCRKPGGGLQTLDALRQFVTTEQGKAAWDDLVRPGGSWDGDVVIYDEDMDLRDKDNAGVTAWAIVPVITPLLSYGSVDFLEGGISSAGHDPDLQTLIVTSEDLGPTVEVPATTKPQPKGLKKGAGLFQLDTQTAFRSKQLPEIEPCSTTSTNPPSPLPARSPLPMMPASSSSSNTLSPADPKLVNIIDSSPSPPPSSISGFRRPPPPRRPSAPNLRRLDTKSAERLNTNLPKLSVRTKPMRSATLTIPPTLSLQVPTSPSHLKLAHSYHSPASPRWTPLSPNPNDPNNYLTPYFTPPHTPGTPKALLPPSPPTARPDFDEPPTTEDAFPPFTVSTILPNFLYLGPELTTPEHVEELQDLGVRRILNIAVECDDDQGLKLKEVFEKYIKIPMRDTVEEDNISKGVREVCEILDDARLHSAPTYVHCKAGKSRSVTAVMAYLIHANHWTLSRAYSFVLERRKGISPNIGFVSELMNFEEQELGGKSVGVQPTTQGSSNNEGGEMREGFGAAVASNHLRRGGHVRDSLPPALGGLEGLSGPNAGPMSAGGLMDRVLGDSGQEMEIKDSSGRYRHARRAPVNENTLQPMRRVSKAGLESSVYG